MNNERFPNKTFLTLLIGELAVSLIICAVYLIIDKFTYRVALGALLGSAVVVVNFLVMAIASGRLLDEFMKERGDGEMSEEETSELVSKYQSRIQNQMKLSFLIRNIVMVLTLVVAFLIDIFDVIATLIPLMLFKPLIMLAELIDRKRGYK